MTLIVTIRRQALFLAAVVVAMAGFASDGFAFTSQQRIACTPDAFRLCSSHIPNVEGITVCMRAQKASLSTACKAVFDK